MIWVALIVAGASLAFGLISFVQSRHLAARLERLRDSFDRFRRQSEAEQERLRQDTARLNYALKKQSGTLRFHENMTFREALAINPKVEEVMASLHVGGCPDCAVDLNETLAYGAAKNAVDVEAFLIALNNLPESEYEKVAKQVTSSSLNVIR